MNDEDMTIGFNLTLPSSLTHLSLASDFDFMPKLPLSITHLCFGYYFNQPLYGLPSSLVYLRVGVCFDQAIDNLPSSLRHLHLASECFDRPIDHLPSSLQTLAISENHNFNHSVDNLPLNLSHFSLSGQLNQPLVSLPPNLTHLTIDIYNFNHPVDCLPSPLTHFTLESGQFNHPLTSLPLSLQQLILNFESFQQPLDKLPPQLTHLHINAPKFNQPLNMLPQSLTHLFISSGTPFNLPLENVLLPHLMELFLPDSFNHPLTSLPPLLKVLDLGYDFDSAITLPSYLNTLKFGHKFNQPIVEFPQSLQNLCFGVCFNQEIDFCSLPHLRKLKLGKGSFPGGQPNPSFPSSLTHLTIYKNETMLPIKLTTNLLKLRVLNPKNNHIIGTKGEEGEEVKREEGNGEREGGERAQPKYLVCKCSKLLNLSSILPSFR